MAKSKPQAKKKVAAKKVAPKKVVKKVAPKKTGSLLKAASKMAAKISQKLNPKDAARAKAQALKEKEMAKKEALKEKLALQKQKEAEKKSQEKAKLQAKKDQEQAKKDAAKAKVEALKTAQKEKVLALKEQEKAKKEALKQAEKDKKIKEKEALKLAKKSAKLKAKSGEEEDEEGGSVAPRSNPDDDDFEEELKQSLKKTKTGKKAYEDDIDVDLSGFKKYSRDDLELKIADEIADLREHFSWKEIADAILTMDFFIDPKNDECIEKGCDNIRTTQAYCRLHYLKNWKSTQKKKEILKEGRLQEYIEELLSKYPPKFMEALLSDLADDKEFYKILGELNITSDFDFDEEELEANDDDDDGDDIGIENRFTGSMRYEEDT